MDSEQFFYLDEELDVSEVRELQSDELRCVEHYVEVTRHLQEIQQLYQIVLFNLSIMRKVSTHKGQAKKQHIIRQLPKKQTFVTK